MSQSSYIKKNSGWRLGETWKYELQQYLPKNSTAVLKNVIDGCGIIHLVRVQNVPRN